MTHAIPDAGAARRENALLALFRIKVFRRIWAAITFSSLGDWLGLLANTALAQQLTREQSYATQGFAISGVILIRLAPDLLFGPFAAAIADKFDRRKTVIAGELTAGILYASIALGYNLIWLYVAQFVIEAAGLFTQPAKQVIWVAITPKRLLATANQISLMSVYGSVPVASGVFALLSAADRLISNGHTGGTNHVNAAIVIALLLNTVSFFVSATTVFLSRAQIPVVPSAREQGQGIFGLLREGVSFVRRNALIRGLYVGVVGAFAAGGFVVGVAQQWVRTLSAGTAGYAIMFGTVFTGLAIGMLIGPRILPSYSRSRVFGLAIGGAGVTLLLMSVIRNFILADGLAALVGVFAGMAWVIGYTLIGQEVEDRLRGRTFAFVLSSVRIILLLSVAVGGQLAGLFGTHAIEIGSHSRLVFSGPGLTLLVGGVLALTVSFYATPRSHMRVRDIVRQRVLRSDLVGVRDHQGLFVCIDGVDPVTTARYAALVAAEVEDAELIVFETTEPSQTQPGRQIAELMQDCDELEPETVALLSAADRAEHVARVIRPALDRREVVVCDRYVLTSLALHGGGRGADVGRVRSVNGWGTSGLLPDLGLVVHDGAGDDAARAPLPGAAQVDVAAAFGVLRAAATADPDRYVVCPADVPSALPEAVSTRLRRLIDYRASLLAVAAAPDPVAEPPDADFVVDVAAVEVSTEHSTDGEPGIGEIDDPVTR